MRAAVGQFVVQPMWQDNAGQIIQMMAEASANHTDLLVLPEAILARNPGDPEWGIKTAQQINGPFVSRLLAASRHSALTTVLTILTPAPANKVYNTLLAIRNGQPVAQYHKLHLYDAFGNTESARVTAGTVVPALIDVAGMQVGLMTCYDLRFPEMALALALAGAQVIALPAAWVRGEYKMMHWQTLLAARALDTTCYLLAAGECGSKNCGFSQIVSPLGQTLAGMQSESGIVYAHLDTASLNAVREQLPVLANRRFRAPGLA